MHSPLTGSSDTVLLKTMSAESLIADWKSTYQIDITKELHDVPEIETWRCNNTGLRFFAPSTVAGSGWLYEQLQKIDWYYPLDKWEHSTALTKLRGCGRVLEVGCGHGSFIASALENGLDAEGIELNPAAVDAARTAGLPVQLVDLEDAAEQHPEEFDAVCSFQVLEHVPNPGDFIRWSLRLLKPGGKLIACVPNANSFIKHRYDLLNLPPHHMSHWDCKTFKALEKCFKIRLEMCISEPLDTRHINNYLQGYRNYYRKHVPVVGRMLFNYRSEPIYDRLLRRGFWKFATGQSLYAQFAKVG